MDDDLTAIWKRLDGSLKRFVARRVGPREAVEDIVQEIYLKIHTGLDRLRNPDRLESWVFHIARNAIIDHYRRRRPTEELTEELEGGKKDHEESDLENDLRGDVRAMVAGLPPIYREAIALTDLGDMSQVELARRLGISRSGAKSRVQRGRALLRDMLLDCCHFQFDRLGRVIDYYPCCRVCCAAPAPRDAPATCGR